MAPDRPTNVQAPLPVPVAARAVLACAVETVRLLARGRVHLPRGAVGTVIAFADGTTGRVYRETTVDVARVDAPTALVVEFRLRGIRGRGHALFRWESLLNTPLFVGFPGFVSKLWLAHDTHDVYRGIYEWDGPARAEHYARSLWRILALVCEPGSIAYVVVPGFHRDELVRHPERLEGVPLPNDDRWWRPTASTVARVRTNG